MSIKPLYYYQRCAEQVYENESVENLDNLEEEIRKAEEQEFGEEGRGEGSITLFL